MDTYSRSSYFHRDLVQEDDLDWEDDTDPKVRRRREAAKAAEKEELDDKLDIALEESFPGSDPISIVQPAQSPYEKSKF
jgi:predicted  nucleic acid-binding Zn-ribbon protein